MPEAVAAVQSALRGLLTEHGRDSGVCDDLSLELIRGYPLVRREGLRAGVLRPCEYGMHPGEAREIALELLAFELLGRESFERALAIVGERCGERDPQGICLRGAQLRRQVTQRARIHEPRPIGARMARLALGWLVRSR